MISCSSGAPTSTLQNRIGFLNSVSSVISTTRPTTSGRSMSPPTRSSRSTSSTSSPTRTNPASSSSGVTDQPALVRSMISVSQDCATRT
ncbi:Uncharacterised protein [Mycobacteroides abscessus subsp. abscessus]|nr:Uncharacterised protein [Mycobacteroides abscessus subsp. abscessus]